MDSVRIQRSICRFDFTSACSNTFSFFVADHFLKADHHMAHGYMAAPSAVVEWFPQFKCATISKSTTIFDTLYHILILCILWLYEESAVFCFVLFLLLPSFLLFLSFFIVFFVVLDIDVCFFLTLKELVFDSVFTVYGVWSLTLIFFPPACCWTRKKNCSVEWSSSL